MTEKVIYAFTASWCGPCTRLKPYINKLAEEYPVVMIDIDEDQKTAELANIKSVPTISFVEDDEERERLLNPDARTLKTTADTFFG